MNVGPETVAQCVPTNVPRTELGTTRIRLLPSPSVPEPVSCGNVRLGTVRVRRFRRSFAFLNRVRKFEPYRGRQQKSELAVPSPGQVSALIRETARPSSAFARDGGNQVDADPGKSGDLLSAEAGCASAPTVGQADVRRLELLAASPEGLGHRCRSTSMLHRPLLPGPVSTRISPAFSDRSRERIMNV
jgi:hypothetical protein